MIDTDAASEVADRLTRAIIANDADAMAEIYAPDAVIWHCTDQVELTLPQLQDLLRAIAPVATAQVNPKALMVTKSGFVQTQVNVYEFKNGSTTSFHAALVVWLNPEGRISRLEEYLDGAGLAPLIEALGAD